MADRAFGIFDHLERRDVPLATMYEDRLQLMEQADAAGFYACHVAEHHQTPLGMAPSPSVYLSAVAQRTKRLRFGPLVYLLPLYHPLRLIDEVCMLDQMSGGRLELGVGRGVSPYELAYYDVPFLRSRELFEEVLAVLIKGLREQRITHRGRHFDLVDVPIELRPVQQPNPPLWFGVTTEPNVRFAASHGMNPIMIAPNHVVEPLRRQYLDLREAARGTEADFNAHVAEPKIGALRHIYVAETDAEADAVAKPSYQVYYANITKLWHDFGTQPTLFTDDLDVAVNAEVAITGSPARVREHIASYFDTTGCNYMVLSFAWGSLDAAQSRRSMELFTSEVMPAFVEAAATTA